ncbi:MAG: preprotein translocase subunit SecG [Bacteroidota bacterium]
MYTFIIVLLIIVSILLGLIILVQNSKGGGLAAGLSASNQIMGVRKTTDFLEKLTWGFAMGLLVLAIVANFSLHDNTGKSDTGNSMIQEQIDNTAAPAQPQQQAPVAAPDSSGR